MRPHPFECNSPLECPPRTLRHRCGARSLASRTLLGIVAAIALGSLLAGCARPIDESWRGAPRLPYRTAPPPESPPPLVHCNDRTGHIAGTLPWVFGGTCLCNPSVSVLADYKAHGALTTWSVATLEAYYRRRGITTLADHRNCNNLCASGPHLRKGGRCLVPPTPGTVNWEEVLSGTFALPPWDIARVEGLGGAFPQESLPAGAGDASPPTEDETRARAADPTGAPQDAGPETDTPP